MRILYAICLAALALAARPAHAQFYGYSGYYYCPSTYTWPSSYSAYSAWPTYQRPYAYQSSYYTPSYYTAPSVATSYYYTPSYYTAPSVATSYYYTPSYSVAPPVVTTPSVARSYYYTPQAAPSTVTIGIYFNVFSSSAMNVQTGTTVHWVNQSDRMHTITASDGRWDSGDIAPGGNFDAVFRYPGVYHYYCRHHPGMMGMIIVEDR